MKRQTAEAPGSEAAEAERTRSSLACPGEAPTPGYDRGGPRVLGSVGRLRTAMVLQRPAGGFLEGRQQPRQAGDLLSIGFSPSRDCSRNTLRLLGFDSVTESFGA